MIKSLGPLLGLDPAMLPPLGQMLDMLPIDCALLSVLIKKVGTDIYRYFNTTQERYFGIEEIWINKYFKIPVTDLERTMLEGFASPSVFGGTGKILNILKENLHKFNLERLISYAIRYGTASVAKRLGWSLEQSMVSW